MSIVESARLTKILTFLVLWLFSLIPLLNFILSDGYLDIGSFIFPLYNGYQVKYLLPLFVYTPQIGINPIPIGVLTFYLWVLPIENSIILAKVYLVVINSVIFIIIWKLADEVLLLFKINKFALKIFIIIYFYLIPMNLLLISSLYYNVILAYLANLFVLINLIRIQLYSKLTKNRILLSGIALGFSAMMDPRFYVWFIYEALIFLVTYSILNRKNIRNMILNLGMIFLVSTPFVMYIYYLFVYPNLIHSSFLEAIHYQSPRPISLDYIAGFSQNANFVFLFLSISNWWPSLIFSSPSILFYPRHEWFYLPTYGFNAQLLLPNDLLSYAWLVSLFVFLIFVAISLIDKSKRPIVVELLSILLFMVAIESGTNFPFRDFTYALEVAPSQIPVIGGVLQLTFAIPFYAEWVNIPIYLILSTVGFNYIQENQKNVKTKYLLVTSLLLLMFFASWQYFNGELFPGIRSSAFPGNGISLHGMLHPLYPPRSWDDIMNIISRSDSGVMYIGDIGDSDRWTEYQFLAYSPPVMPGYMTINPPHVIYVNQTPLAYDIAGVRYLFIDDTSIIPLDDYIIYNYINHSGLKLVYAENNMYLLEQPNATIFREAKMGIYFNCTNETVLFDAEWLLYPLLNYTPAIISPVKVPNTIAMVLNPSLVKGGYISFYNMTMNVTFLRGNYIVITNGNIARLAVESEINITVRPWTMIVPETINLAELRSYPLNFSFNQFMAQFTVNSDPGYLVVSSLPLPNGSVETSNGKALGVNGFGQYVFLANGKLTISIKLGFVTNLIITLVDVFFYALFVYLIIVKSITKRNFQEVLKSAVTRTDRLKSNK